MVREERFKMVSGGIVNCAFMARTDYELLNGGGWKHADFLILMEVALGPSVTAFNVWHHRVNYWGPMRHQGGLCNPHSSRARISLVSAVPEGPAH
jgi:hypothetical protein